MPQLLSLRVKAREPCVLQQQIPCAAAATQCSTVPKILSKKRKEKVQVTNLIPISMWENVDSVLLCWGYLNEGCCFHHETCINNCGLREGKEYKKKKILDEYSSLCSVIYSLTTYFVTFKSPKPY